MIIKALPRRAVKTTASSTLSDLLAGKYAGRNMDVDQFLSSEGRDFLQHVEERMRHRDESIRHLPAELNVSAVDAYLARSGDREDTVRSLLQADRLLFVDYHVLDDTPFKGGTMLYRPIVLFVIRTGNTKHRLEQMMPLAIQLTRSRSDNNFVYTPDSPKLVWQFAKLHVLHADSVVHQARSNILLLNKQ